MLCCFAMYVLGLKATFSSNSVTSPTDDGSELSYPSPQYDFPLFLESLRKLATYEVALCGFEHHGIFIGEQANKVLRQGLEQAERFRDYLMEQYQRLGDWDEVAQRLATEEIEKIKFPSVNLEFQTSLAKTVISKVLR